MPGTRGTRPSETKRPSTLLDTRVVRYYDDLEQQRQMQPEKPRMMKPARFLILHSSFILQPLALPARHYVKVKLDQIFGENNFFNVW
jgi:hypothetical protein